MLPNNKKGKEDFYSIIGVNKDADSDAIKSAYHQKAKKVHPDKNNAENAAEEFAKLLEAYKTLADPKMKLAYDITNNADDAELDLEDEPCCSMCHTKSRNLRFVIFKEVTNHKFKTVPRVIKGVFCLKCAGIAAVRASMRTWLSGIWLFPFGTMKAVVALLNNIKGGKKPNKLNSRLLIHYAKYLIEKGNYPEAKNAATEALKFTKVPSQVNSINQLLKSLKDVEPRKDKWKNGVSYFAIQVAPLVMMITLLGVMGYYYYVPKIDKQISDSYNENEQESLKVVNLPDDPLDENLIYKVKYDYINIYQGPGFEFGIVSGAFKGTTLRIIGLVPGTLWVKVKTDEAEGFVISEFLEKNLTDNTAN